MNTEPLNANDVARLLIYVGEDRELVRKREAELRARCTHRRADGSLALVEGQANKLAMFCEACGAGLPAFALSQT
jgi:hypothetical protein